MKLAMHGGGSLEVSEDAFGAKFNEALIHQVITAYMAGGRAGTKAQKTRAEVRGGGRKPFKQKGTGRARAGTTRGPIWVGGGRAFAAKPRDYSQKVNRKMYQAAMRSVFSELVRQERLILVDEIELARPKTRDLVALLKGLGLERVLILVDECTDNLRLSARNLYQVEIVDIGSLNPLALVRFEKVLATAAAVKARRGASVMMVNLANEKLMSVLVGPHLSEKSSRVAERVKQFVFKVRRDADKAQVKRAVELMFDVKVTAVQVVHVAGKVRRLGRSIGRRQDWKKAYVTLAEGQDIDFHGNP